MNKNKVKDLIFRLSNLDNIKNEELNPLNSLFTLQLLGGSSLSANASCENTACSGGNNDFCTNTGCSGGSNGNCTNPSCVPQ